VHVGAHPLAGGQLRRRGQRPVRHQAEQHPLRGLHVTGPARPAGGQPGEDHANPEPLPQLVQHVGAAAGPRPGERQARVRGGCQRAAGLQQPAQRRDEAADGVLVELVLAAEAAEDPRHRPPLACVPLAVRQVQVADRAGLGLPGRGLHVHVSSEIT
jgi:hypothetical protein